MTKRESPLKKVLDVIDDVNNPEAKEYIKLLFEEERQMVADAWRRGNRQGWEMSTDWPDHGESYFDEIFEQSPEQ